MPFEGIQDRTCKLRSFCRLEDVQIYIIFEIGKLNENKKKRKKEKKKKQSLRSNTLKIKFQPHNIFPIKYLKIYKIYEEQYIDFTTCELPEYTQAPYTFGIG